MSAKKQQASQDATPSQLQAITRPSVKAKVVSHSRDYLTLEFIGSEPKAFAAGEIVSVSKE